MKILGIETSCDETAVAIVDDQKNILAHALNSQIELHKKYGGVIPELAARGHVEILDVLILQALKEANLKLEEIDGFAATSGPGLIGGVIVGMMAAKTLASVFQKPFLAVNHLEAHALTARLTSDLANGLVITKNLAKQLTTLSVKPSIKSHKWLDCLILAGQQ